MANEQIAEQRKAAIVAELQGAVPEVGDIMAEVVGALTKPDLTDAERSSLSTRFQEINKRKTDAGEAVKVLSERLVGIDDEQRADVVALFKDGKIDEAVRMADARRLDTLERGVDAKVNERLRQRGMSVDTGNAQGAVTGRQGFNAGAGRRDPRALAESFDDIYNNLMNSG